MALSDAFLNTCRTRVLALAELTTVRTPVTTLAAADTRADQYSAWNTLYAPNGLTSILRRAIRGVVNAEADLQATGSATGAVSTLERQSAVSTLESDFVPDHERPASDADD